MRQRASLPSLAGRNSRTRQAFCWTIVLLFLLTALSACSKEGHQPQVVRATLDNGLRVVIVPNNLAPVATVMINYLAGSNEAPRGFPAWPTPRNT